MKLTPEQLDALREVVACKVRLWDACGAAEKLFDEEREFDTSYADCLAVILNDPSEASILSEENIIAAFKLQDIPGATDDRDQ